MLLFLYKVVFPATENDPIYYYNNYYTCISRKTATVEWPLCVCTSGSIMTYWHSTTGSNTTFININTAILSSPTSWASTRVATIWTSSTYTSMTGFQSLALILILAGQALTNKTENKHHATVSLIKYHTIYNLPVYWRQMTCKNCLLSSLSLKKCKLHFFRSTIF